MMGIPSEKCIIRGVPHCASITECSYAHGSKFSLFLLGYRPVLNAVDNCKTKINICVPKNI